MAAPPLQLEHSFVRALAFDATETSPDQATAQSGVVKVSLAQNEADETEWQVGLDIHVDPTEDHPAPYRIFMQMLGLFRVPPGLEKSEAMPLLGVTGASMLYSAAREHLLLVTGRGPWGPWQLPTTRFEPPPEEPSEVPKSTKRRRSGPAQRS